MTFEQHSELIAIYKEVFPTERFFADVHSAAKENGFHFVMRILRQTRAVSALLGWEKASYGLFEAIMLGEIQTKLLDEDGEEDAKPDH